MKSKVLGGILLVAGTTIGAGMLALPVVTGLSGLLPTLVLFTVFWLFMTYTALLFLEVNLWMEDKANMITMAKRTLGRTGEVIAWCMYLYLLYALTTAYLAGSAPIVLDFFKNVLGMKMPIWVGALPILLLFGAFIYRGVQSVDSINRVMMIGLAIAFMAMIILLAPYVDEQRLHYKNWRYLPLSIGFAATSFGFHVIIPSLAEYLNHNPHKMRIAIWLGSIIPLSVYILWEILSLGIIPLEGPHGIIQGFKEGSNGATLLASGLHHPMILLLAQLFSFFAIVTSFLGVSLSLSDFLADGLKIRRDARGNFILCALTFIPPILFILTDPRAFLSALDYAGAFGVMILLGFLPVWMVWVGRYQQHRVSTYKAPGGKIALILALIFSMTIIFYEMMIKFWDIWGKS